MIAKAFFLPKDFHRYEARIFRDHGITGNRYPRGYLSGRPRGYSRTSRPTPVPRVPRPRPGPAGSGQDGLVVAGLAGHSGEQLARLGPLLGLGEVFPGVGQENDALTGPERPHVDLLPVFLGDGPQVVMLVLLRVEVDLHLRP